MANDDKNYNAQRFGEEDDPFRLDPNFSSGLMGHGSALKEVNPDQPDPWLEAYGDRLDTTDRTRFAAKAGLKNFIENLTEEDIEEAARNSPNPEFKKQVAETLRDFREDKAAEEFVKRHPEYLAVDSNYHKLLEYLAEEKLPLTIVNLETAYAELTAAGALEVEGGLQKELSDKEKLAVSRVAVSGKVGDAIGLYLHYALPGLSPQQIVEAIKEPELVPLCDDAVYFVFAQATPDYRETTEAVDFINNFVGDRPITYRLLEAAWKASKESKAQRAQQAASEPAPVDYNDLPQDQFDEVYHATLRERARQIKGR
jgi:hypothetical protein